MLDLIFKLKDNRLFNGVTIPKSAVKACPGNAVGVYYATKDGCYYLASRSGSIEVDEQSYILGTSLTRAEGKEVFFDNEKGE